MLFQPREHLPPDSIPRNTCVLIRRILAPSLPISAQPGAQFHMRTIEQRPRIPDTGDNMNRPESGKSGRASSPKQTQQQSLGDIVRRMPRGDGVEALLLRNLPEKRLPRRAGSHLHGQMGRRGNTGGLHPKSRPETFRQSRHKSRVRGGNSAAQPVIEMQHDRRYTPLGANRKRQAQQRHGIGTARNRNAKPPHPRQHPVAVHPGAHARFGRWKNLMTHWDNLQIHVRARLATCPTY